MWLSIMGPVGQGPWMAATALHGVPLAPCLEGVKLGWGVGGGGCWCCEAVQRISQRAPLQWRDGMVANRRGMWGLCWPLWTPLGLGSMAPLALCHGLVLCAPAGLAHGA